MKLMMVSVGKSISGFSLLDFLKIMDGGKSLISVDVGIHGNRISGEEFNAWSEGGKYPHFVQDMVEVSKVSKNQMFCIL